MGSHLTQYDLCAGSAAGRSLTDGRVAAARDPRELGLGDHLQVIMGRLAVPLRETIRQIYRNIRLNYTTSNNAREQQYQTHKQKKI